MLWWIKTNDNSGGRITGLREFIREPIERQHTTAINELSGMEGRLVTEENKVLELLLGHEHLTVSENEWPLKYIQLESLLASLFTGHFEWHLHIEVKKKKLVSNYGQNITPIGCNVYNYNYNLGFYNLYISSINMVTWAWTCLLDAQELKGLFLCINQVRLSFHLWWALCMFIF